MPKPKKTKIKLDDVDSLTVLMQELYNDIQTVQKKAREDIEAREKSIKIENSTDTFQVGKVNNESLKIISTSIEQKISLAKLQAQIIQNDKSKSPVGGEGNKSGLDDESKKIIRELLNKKQKQNNTEFDI
jgi:hypothetical protein